MQVPSIILERSEASGLERGRKSWSGERRKVAQRNVGALDDDTLPAGMMSGGVGITGAAPRAEFGEYTRLPSASARFDNVLPKVTYYSVLQ